MDRFAPKGARNDWQGNVWGKIRRNHPKNFMVNRESFITNNYFFVSLHVIKKHYGREDH